MLPGDELVADYLARAGRAAAVVLPPAECAAVVEEVSRQVRARVGPPPRRDAGAVARRLSELGGPEQLVAATARASGSFRPSIPFPVSGQDDQNDTIDLGTVPAPARSPRVEVRVADPGADAPRRRLGGIIRTLPDFRNSEHDSQSGHGLRVRPIDPDESVRGESLAGLGRLGWEIAALVVLALGVFMFGFLAWILGALLVSRSRFWEIRDKVRVLLGVPLTALVVAVLWAWVRATQIQESNHSGTRVSVAGNSLADSLAAMPELFGVSAALYLGYALVRDHHTD